MSTKLDKFSLNFKPATIHMVNSESGTIVVDDKPVDRRKKVGLYRCVYDPKETQIGYSLKFVPYSVLSKNLQRMVSSNEEQSYSREAIETMCNDELTHLMDDETVWQIVWRNNAVPTEIEWKKMSKISVEFRVTNLHGCVAILHKWS